MKILRPYQNNYMFLEQTIAEIVTWVVGKNESLSTSMHIIINYSIVTVLDSNVIIKCPLALLDGCLQWVL